MKKQTNPEYGSAIGQHLLESSQCAANYQEHQFSILDTARGRFHLSLLEATYIKIRRLTFADQKSSLTVLTSSNRNEVLVKLFN